MKFSRILAPLCALAMTACAYVIPPDENAPRNNTVTGAPHRPQLNSNTGPQSNAAPMRQQAPVMARNDAFPPVDAATQAQAEKEIAQNTAISPLPVSTERRVPIENSQFQMAANDYPSLNSVPPRPVTTGPESTKARLSDVESDLVQERNQAITSKDNLAKDAASEPSMLSDLPKSSSIVPPNDPVNVAPVDAVRRAPADNAPVVKIAPHVEAEPALIKPVTAKAEPVVVKAAPVKSVAISTPIVSTPVAVAPITAASTATLPATPNFAPPAPMNAGSLQQTARTTPITLMPPVETASSVNVQDLPPTRALPPVAAPVNVATTATATGPTIRPGDFDPLAAADNAPIASASSSSNAGGAKTVYVSNTYLAPSRYADRRY